MKAIILSAMLLAAAFVLAPPATAACEPGLDRDFCTGIVTSKVEEHVACFDELQKIPCEDYA